jgi:ATP/maltotriose-dependent transcriptional regulator MalT
MGTLDKWLEKASGVASDAGRTGRVAQAQIKLRSLQGDLKDARAELGAVAFGLADRGDISHPELEAALTKVRTAEALVREKEAEIGQIKAEGKSESATEDAADAGGGPAAGGTAE